MATVSDKAIDIGVFTACEAFGIAFAFDVVETLRHGGGLLSALPSGLVALACIAAGAIFPSLRKHVAAKKKVTLLLLLAISAAATDRLLHGNPAFRLAAISMLCLWVIIAATRYVVRIRRDLDIYVMPRVLSQKQISELRLFLSQHEPQSVTVKVDPLDQEATQYWSQLCSALKGTDWNVETSTASAEPRIHINYGLHIHEQGINSKLNDPKNDAASILRQAFQVARIQVDGAGSVGAGEYRLFILVGHRPLAVRMGPPILSRLGNWIQRLGYNIRAHALCFWDLDRYKAASHPPMPK